MAQDGSLDPSAKQTKFNIFLITRNNCANAFHTNSMIDFCPLALQREGTKRDVFLGSRACASLAETLSSLLLFVIYLFTKMHRCLNEMKGETQESTASDSFVFRSGENNSSKTFL